jgi:site-specific DNA-methyltransferase (adenine-specific)
MNNNNFTILNDDCNKAICNMDDNLIDLIVTSPPYNVDLGNNKYNKNPYDLYNDNKDHQQYLMWLENIFKDAYPKLKSGGRVSINVGDGKNGAIPTHSDITHFMTSHLKYIPMTTIVWNKNTISNRTAWGSFQSPSSPSFPKPFEYIMIFAKENKKLQEKGETDLTKEEFIQWSNALWSFTPETRAKKIGHPAPFPIELPHRLIKMLTWKNATVLDPFCGSGTTGMACKKLDRDFIGIDISPEYCELARKRIENTYKIVDIFEDQNV